MPLEAIAAEVVAELESLAPADDEVLSLRASAGESGYSVDRLQKLVADGSIPNAGRKGKPGIRRGDLPRKPARALRSGPDNGHFPPRRRIVLAAHTESRKEV